MSWFKVDDHFHSHPKVRGLDMASRGLWVTAGAWCASYLTDGELSERDVKALGGTRRQAEKLVAAGLWTLVDDAPGARRYAFHDWAEFQPTRADVSAKRQEARNRMANARAKKRDTSENAEMFARTARERSREVRSDAFEERSHYPDPTRPDPTFNGGTGSQPSYGGTARATSGGGDSEPVDPLAAAAQRARDAGISERAIQAGTHEFERRPHPKGPGLLRTLIDDAWREERTAARTLAAIDARRTAREECAHCNDQGFIETTIDGHPAVIRCNHQPPAHLDPDDDTPPWEKHA